LSHHDQQASDDQNQTEHGQMLSSNMLLLNLILLIDVTFSTPTPDFTHCGSFSRWQAHGYIKRRSPSQSKRIRPPTSGRVIALPEWQFSQHAPVETHRFLC
jgi:hypothetical protein